jgi:PAS domain S-box-containing protein
VIGIIDSEHPNKDYFSGHDLKIFKSIASILSFKISQVKAIEDLATINKELEVQNLEKQKQANELVIAKKEYDSQNQQQKKIVDKLSAEIVKLEFENHQNKTKATELDVAIKKSQKEAEAIAIKEIAFKKELKKTRIETESIANELRQFIETANAPIFGIDSEGMVNEWNQTSEKITGFTKKEVLGQDLVKRYITSAYQTKVKKVLDNALKGEETANFEFPIFSKDGNRVMILLNSSTRRNVNGEIIGMLGVGQDISKMDELRTVSDAIAKELRQFIETANAPIFGIDSNGMVNEWNQSSEKITGFTKEEVLGEDLVATYINSNYQKSVKKVLDNAQRGVETANFEFPLYAKDGKRIMILLNSSTRRNSDGKIIGMLGVGQDITILNEYKKNLESKVEYRTQELQESLEREKELGQLKTSFVSMASHEFRTPLTSIKAISDIILRYSNKLSQESINARLEKIKKEVDDMTIMLDDILIIGKSEAQKLAFNPDIEDIVFLIRQIITEYQFSDTTNRQLIYDIPNSIIMINVDKKWIKHIIINLISNAEKYSNKNTPIKISIHQNQSNISFSFQDYGIGISKQDIKKLFEPFHRGSNAQNIPGTGLGLSVLQQAVDLHNGKIEVESNLGKGSKFKIILPYNID